MQAKVIMVVYDCEYMKIVYVNCYIIMLKNEYESNLHSNEHN